MSPKIFFLLFQTFLIIITQWKLFFGTPPPPHPSFRGHKIFVPDKCSHNLCICYLLYWRDTSLQRKGRLFVGPEIQVYPHSGDILALKIWLSPKKVDILKRTLITMMTTFWWGESPFPLPRPPFGSLRSPIFFLFDPVFCQASLGPEGVLWKEVPLYLTKDDTEKLLSVWVVSKNRLKFVCPHNF